jgi:hypothetical protein
MPRKSRDNYYKNRRKSKGKLEECERNSKRPAPSSTEKSRECRKRQSSARQEAFHSSLTLEPQSANSTANIEPGQRLPRYTHHSYLWYQLGRIQELQRKVLEFMRNDIDLHLSSDKSPTTLGGSGLDMVFTRHVDSLRCYRYISSFSYHTPILAITTDNDDTTPSTSTNINI